MLNRPACPLRSQKLLHCTCPDYDGARQVCLAATTQLIPGRKQQMAYCASDDYDNCPVYLGKALRSSRTQGGVRDSLLDSGK